MMNDYDDELDVLFMPDMGDGHIDGEDCWCDPHILVTCPEECGVGCWRCRNGYIMRPWGYVGEIEIVHNYNEEDMLEEWPE